jgi:glycosyltransferase involved in cell wall biosynthesis
MARKWSTLVRPYSFFLSDDLRRDVVQALRDGYDILNLEQMWTAYLGHGVERALLSVHHLELLDLAGAFSPSLKFFATKHMMQRAERHLAAGSANIRVTTERLRREVTRLNPRARIFKVPVAIDPELYEFAPCHLTGTTVGLIASLSWSPGYNAAVRLLTRVWPKVKKAVPNANLLIVGWDARRVLGRYLGGDDVTVVENVPDTKGYFRKLSVLTYPLSQGSGMKIKLLEAMAYGTPVVTTTEGAEGLAVVDGHEAFVADEDDAIADRTVQLLMNRDLAERVSRAARALVERDYSPGPVVAQMERIYDELLSGNG